MSGSMLPPDLRAQVEQNPGAARRGFAGIGGGARENRGAAAARAQAMGDEAPGESTTAPQEDGSKIAGSQTIECPSCHGQLPDEARFCHLCGYDVVSNTDPAKVLELKFTEQDVEEYLFKGFIVRELKLFGTHKITARTSQPKDMRLIDEFLYNSDYVSKIAKGKDKKERRVSEIWLKQVNALALTAMGVLKIDADLLPEDLEEKIKLLEEKGSAFVDRASQLVVLFNRAWTQYLGDLNKIVQGS